MNEFEKEKSGMEEFERELREAFARRPAPPSVKRRLEERGLLGRDGADRNRLDRKRRAAAQQPAFTWITWQKLAACLVLTAVLAGSVEWRMAEQRRKEEAAREQVLTALRITSHALNQMNARLAARHHSGED
jgi:hypothetical protein